MSPAVAAAKSRVPEGGTTADAGSRARGVVGRRRGGGEALGGGGDNRRARRPRGPPSRWSSAATRAPSESEAAAAVVTFVTVNGPTPPRGDPPARMRAVAASTGSSATILSTPRGIEPGTSHAGVAR